jgi:hypothetical protein
MSAKVDNWTHEPLNRVVRAVFDRMQGHQEELAETLGLKGTTISHAKKRAGAFQKHVKGVAQWLGLTMDQLEDLARSSDSDDFEKEIDRVVEAKTGKRNRIYKNIQIVKLAKGAAAGPGRLAVIALSTPDDGSLVCFLASDGWQIGRFYRANDGVMIVQPNKRAHHWPAATAPECSPLLMIGERPDERKFN